ncbi:MAG: hypothetical protein HFH91_00020 [Lachnospiraceae bacterium]|jgi:hypothetical protein|nr:hypothetical protein [Lachnospiraceae bacterium]
MLTILIDWIYILFTCFSSGFFFLWMAEKRLRYSVKRMDSVLMAGLVIATVYAQSFSLLYRVNVEANIVLSGFCILICVVLRRQMKQFLRERLANLPLSARILIPLLFVLWSFFASRGYMVPDMDIYHGQSIRWIEEYGVVKGLGNLHCRFGYNSSIFAVSALYSMKFLLGRSLHAINGLIAFILSLTALELGKAFRRRRMLLSDYARVGAIYYLTTIYDEVIAPSSDYAVMCVIFFIIIKWLTQLEKEDAQERDRIAPYALLCVMGIWTITLKLTAGLILLLTVKPACMLIKNKKWKETGIYLVLGLVTAIPWMARTVIITGWLLYPFADLDLFSVDWKIVDESIIRRDSYLIRIWAKAANTLKDTSLRSWFPHWFRNALSTMERLLVVTDLVVCAGTAVSAVIIFVKRRWRQLDLLLVMGTLSSCYLFWQFSAPMVRYGYAYVLLTAAVAGGYILEKLKLTKFAYLALVLYGAYKVYTCCGYVTLCWLRPCYIWSETYESYEVESYEVDGVTFYYSPYEGPTGYDAFPSAPTRAELELRGEGLKDGFRPK